MGVGAMQPLDLWKRDNEYRMRERAIALASLRQTRAHIHSEIKRLMQLDRDVVCWMKQITAQGQAGR